MWKVTEHVGNKISDHPLKVCIEPTLTLKSFTYSKSNKFTSYIEHVFWWYNSWTNNNGTGNYEDAENKSTGTSLTFCCA